MKFNYNFIGYEHPGTDILKKGVYYKYNSLGHRCKEPTEIDFDNYILFTGCSHTEGEAVKLEQSYPYLTAQLLNCDYYNLGLSASGFDVVFYNLMSWLKTYKKPKLLVIQYPDASRFAVMPAFAAPTVTPLGSWNIREKWTEYYVNSDKMGSTNFKNFCNIKLLSLYLDVPTVKLIFGSTKPYDSDCIRIDRLDYGTDGQHYGPETHKEISEIIHDEYTALQSTS